MKKLVFTLLAGAMLLAGSNLKAQNAGVNGFKFGIGLEGALPLSGLKASYDVGAGLTLRFSQGIAENFDATLTTGAIAFIPKDLANANLDTKAAIWIPIKAGGRYMFSENFYGMAEAGVTIAKTYLPSAAGGNVTSVSSTSFTYAPGVGAKFGGFDIGVRYEGLDGAGFMGLRLGFTF
ncbi:MAG: hypothetical protein EOO91_06485 [Pedobacter sp.]|nr:MAG: hypothetical protein EOO91_06485 [Pedobacter sp.]